MARSPTTFPVVTLRGSSCEQARLFIEVRDPRPRAPGEQRQTVWPRIGRAHHVQDRPPPDEQGVSDQRSMASPRYGFGAHDGDRLPPGHIDQLVEPVGERRRMHVVGARPEACVRPHGVLEDRAGHPSSPNHPEGEVTAGLPG